MSLQKRPSIRGRWHVALAMLSAVVGFFPHSAAGADADHPPNIVLIIADDMAWTDFGFMGHPQIRTPCLDKLAVQSLAFRRGYVTSSLCSPSLASILTGLYPHQHKITSNDPPLPPGVDERSAQRNPAFLAARQAMIQYFDEMPTLPRLIGAKDYLSFEAGKWWGGSYQRGGFTHGMTHGDPERGGRHGDAGLAIGRQGLKPVLLFIELAQVRKAPFFLWYAPMMPHQPHNPPARLLEYYRDKTPSLEVAKYWAMCEWFDETCGELLDYLEKGKLAGSTLVIFLADNGYIQDPQADRYAERSKQSPYEGGVRTPILVRWPGRVAPMTVETPVSAIDVAPTVLAAAGVERAMGQRGVNLLDEKAISARPVIFGEVFTHNAVDIHEPATSLRFRFGVAGDWKLIVPDRRNVPVGTLELFDVRHDPGEAHNRAGEKPQKVAELQARLDAWWPGGPR
jgi:uncharacterized sulfatase